MQALATAQARTCEVGVFTRVRRKDQPDLTVLGEPAGPVAVFGFNHLDRRGRSFLERTAFAPAEAAFRSVLADCRPDVVHVHHLSGLSADVIPAAASSGARVVLTIHDHALACPRGQRIRLDLDPCPVIDRDRCVRCVRPSWIQAARSPDRLSALLGLLRPGEGRRLFEVRDAHLRACLDRVAAFIAPSRSAADLFLEYYPAAAARMRVVPHGLRVPRDAPYAPTRRLDDPFVAGFFGSMLPSKGIWLLADVARRLAGERVSIELHGPGPSKVAHALAERSGGNIVLEGSYRPADLGKRMALVDAVLVPSLWPETFSIVVREAWAHRKPVLASATGALVEAAGEGGRRIGLLPPGDEAAWADAILRLARDHAWYAALAGPHAPEPFAGMLEATLACYMGSA